MLSGRLVARKITYYFDLITEGVKDQNNEWGIGGEIHINCSVGQRKDSIEMELLRLGKLCMRE